MSTSNKSVMGGGLLLVLTSCCCLSAAAPPPADYDLEDLEISRDMARLEVKKIEIQLDQARKQHSRLRELSRRGSIAPKVVEQEQGSYRGLEVELAMARLKARRAEIAVRRYRRDGHGRE